MVSTALPARPRVSPLDRVPAPARAGTRTLGGAPAVLERRAARAAVALLAVLTLGACAGTVTRPVAEGDRVSDDRYDGRWLAKVDARGGRQNIERWHFNCGEVKFNWPLEIEDGVVSMFVTDEGKQVEHETFIDEAGRFRMEMPLAESARAGGGSDQQMSDGAITLIFEGELGTEEPRGAYTVGVRQFLDRGCRQVVEYQQVNT